MQIVYHKIIYGWVSMIKAQSMAKKSSAVIPKVWAGLMIKSITETQTPIKVCVQTKLWRNEGKLGYDIFFVIILTPTEASEFH